MFLRARSLLALAALSLAMLFPATSPPSAAAADLTISQAESRMISLINGDRTAAGLVALRVDSRPGQRLWTGVFIKGPDRTGALGRMGSPQTPGPRTSSGTRKITISWTGTDTRLQVLTSGFYSFQLQRRIDGGSWTLLISST